MNWEIIVVIIIAVSGWIITHLLTIKAQEKNFRNQIINTSRLDITQAIREYQEWLLNCAGLIDRVGYDIILEEQGLNLNTLDYLNKITNQYHDVVYPTHKKSFINWLLRLEEYEILFTVTEECCHQLTARHNQIQKIMSSFIQELISATAGLNALEIHKKALKEAEKKLSLIYDQLALMRDLLIYLQNYSLSPIIGKIIPEREPEDPSLPSLYIDKNGYLQFKEATEQN